MGSRKRDRVVVGVICDFAANGFQVDRSVVEEDGAQEGVGLVTRACEAHACRCRQALFPAVNWGRPSSVLRYEGPSGRT